jgi:single-strand DNA-binding protein
MNQQQLQIVTGRLGKEPFLAYNQKGNAICTLSLGIKSEQNLTIWRKVVVFGKLAELCKVHLRKGEEIFVRGPVELRKFISKEGQEKEYLEINAFSIGQSLL